VRPGAVAGAAWYHVFAEVSHKESMGRLQSHDGPTQLSSSFLTRDVPSPGQPILDISIELGGYCFTDGHARAITVGPSRCKF
jgi:hypothetical protein